MNTGHDAAAALHSLHAQGASSYVIDLRGNSGGLVSAGEASRPPLHLSSFTRHTDVPRESKCAQALRDLIHTCFL